MTLRPAPGQQISQGRLRVDATKAIAKLREYQLVDRTAWINEAIRAAVAAGAKSIDLQGDSNDIWLSWSCAPWPAEDLPRLFDELVSPEPGAERHHVRLLAAAVNSALGANPAYVDVYSVTEQGAMRARYTPDVLDVPESDLEESPLRRVKAEPAPIPQGAPVGMHVHYRRRASLEVLSYFLRMSNVPELAMARMACADIGVPIRIGGAELERAKNPRDVVRVPLGNDLDGFLAVTDPTLGAGANVCLDIAERGVLLETSTIDLGIKDIVAPIPLRLFVDGPRMPTNASRSEVRRDAHPLDTADRRAKEVVPALVEKLAEKLRVGTDPIARHSAIRLVASVIASADWAHRLREIGPPFRALADLPLVRDAVGTPRPLAWSWSGLVHTGSEPLPADLAPWLSHVLWAPSDESSWLSQWWIDPKALRAHLKFAKRERRAEKKFYKHEPREPRVLGRRKPRVRARLGAPLADSCVPDSVFEGLTGEVCVYRDRDRRGGSELTLLFGGRELETVRFDSSIAFATVIDSSRVKPTDHFRGAIRDSEYARVERAMRAGVVRAIEAIALAKSGKFADGYQVAVEADADDVQLLRDGLLLSRNLQASLSPPFAKAQIWRTTEGNYSIEQLRNHTVLGVTPSHATVPPLTGRVVVYADDSERALLADVVPVVFVPYEPSHLLEKIEPHELATQIMGTSPHAFAFSEPEVIGAIVPNVKPALLVYHRGVKLADFTYTPTLAPCAIAVESDKVIPNPDWNEIVDDAGLGNRDYSIWERSFARAIVEAIVGYRSPDLIGGGNIDLGGTLGRWLCASLTHHVIDANVVLGEDLAKTLRLRSMFRVLGEQRMYSIDELAVMFPHEILHVEQAAGDAVPGFPVVVVEAATASLIAKLANRRHRDSTKDLAARREALARDLRIGAHRAKPTHPFEVAGTSVKLGNPSGKGVLGVGTGSFVLEVLVEGRLFQTITRQGELPLTAVFEIELLDRIDEKFEAVKPEVIEQLITASRVRSIELLRTIAEKDPEALADSGPRRDLLVAFLTKHAMPPEMKEALAKAIMFPTLDGKRSTIEAACSGTTIVTSTWTGEWLFPDSDVQPNLDRPILATSAGDIRMIVGAFRDCIDVTRDVERLQAQRRIARGLLPSPKVIGPDPELTRRIDQLGISFRHLGPGEIGLAGGASELLLYKLGELRERVVIECVPAVQLAIEAPDLIGDRTGAVAKRMGPEAAALADLLARQVLGKLSAVDLPVEIRRSLRRAVLAGKLLDKRDELLFETLGGGWISLAKVQEQRELFGNLWCVPGVPAHTTPLDERRIVLMLSGVDMKLASDHGIPVIDATIELNLDGKTIANRKRPLADSLALRTEQGVIGKTELDGDGVTAPRGIVAVLSPTAAHKRGLYLHRAMFPFEAMLDLCRWPTVAYIDDARLTPDRVWEKPERDDVYKEIVEKLHRASNEGLRNLVTPPANALASVRVAPWTYDTVESLRGTEVQMRGALWLAGPPVPFISPPIHVYEANTERDFVPLHGPGLAGSIYVYAPNGWRSEKVLEELAKVIHMKLLREISLGGRRDPDLVAAHVAWGLALDRLAPDEAKHVRFNCFRPEPLDASRLKALLWASDQVVKIAPESKYDGFALVEDGSETARVIATWLGGARLRSPSQRQRPDTVEPPSPPIKVPIVEHPLQPFVNKLHSRIAELGIPVQMWRIVDGRETPIVAYRDNVLELAGNHRHVIEVAGAVAANTAWAGDALDALAAHCITVLNVALTSITDAAEAVSIGKLLA